MHVDLGGYHVRDIEFSAAFDIDADKVGKDLSEAIWSGQNNTIKFVKEDVPHLGVPVQRGMTHDGLGKYLSREDHQGRGLDRRHRRGPQGDPHRRRRLLPARRLRAGHQVVRRADPRGRLRDASTASRCSSPARSTGTTASRRPACRSSATTSSPRSARRSSTARWPACSATAAWSSSARRSSTSAATWTSTTCSSASAWSPRRSPRPTRSPRSWTTRCRPTTSTSARRTTCRGSTDRKWAHIRLEGQAFGDVPLTAELKLEVWDSPNSAGIVIDAVRCCKLALNHGIGGQLDGPSSYLMKSPERSGRTTRPARRPRSSSPSTRRRAPRPRRPARPPRRRPRRSPPRSPTSTSGSGGPHLRAAVPSKLRCGARALLHRPGRRRSPGRTPTRSTRSSPSCRASWPRAATACCVLAPSRSPELVRESRRLIRAARERPEELFDPDGGVRVLGVGELLPLQPPRARRPSPPVDVARTIEEVLGIAPLDFVHVHEPFAPSTSSVALRHSRALNVGSFHAPTERVLSTQVARRFVELFFGRLDARTAAFEVTRELMERSFPAELPAAAPRRGGGRPRAARRRRGAGPLRIAFCAQEERGRAAAVPARAAPAPRGRRLAGGRVLADRRGADRRAAQPRARPRARGHGRGDDRGRGARRRRRRRRRLARPGARARAARARARRRRRARVAARLPRLRGGRWATATSACASSPATSTCSPPSSSGSAASRELLRRARASGVRAAPRGPLLGARGRRGRGDLRASWPRRRRAAARASPSVRARLRQAQADRRRPAHAHRPLARLRDAGRRAARDRPRRGLGAIAVTDHNEISGALDARAKAAEYGVKVIVGEEVKTADQGEVIGLFIEEKIPRGLTLEETIAEIKRQGGLVYVPHPFDRLHSVPGLRAPAGGGRRHRRDRGLQPADRDPGLQRGGGALRRQVPDRRRRRLGRARRAGPRRGPDQDARLRRSRGVPRVAARRRHHRPSRPRCATRRCRR